MSEKPGIIEELEKQLGNPLEELPLEKLMGDTKNGYVLDEKGRVMGLNLDKAKIADISFLSEFPGLTHLSLHDNQIADISPLKQLNDLTTLYLENNQIADISPLKQLTQLTTLWLHDNKIADISPLKQLNALSDLRLYNNQIADISPLKQLTQLTTLWLNYNQIADISPLKQLIESGIKVKWEIGLGNGIFLEGNPLEIPPVEIVKQGRDAVLNYFKELEEEPVRLLQSKLLIVGNGAVGKTTLMKKLINPNFQITVGEEDSTRGIDIVPWDLDCPFPDCESEKIKIHFWDFGGQDIYHATHQFFLTKRSLYLFVWEARKEEESRSFDYWLNIIKLLSDESPVIVVMNKSEIRDKHIDEASFKDKFNNIETFLKVSCATGDGIQELTKKISTTMGGMKHLKDKLPKVWQDIRDRLKKEGKDYINLDRYYEICGQFGQDEEGADFLSDYLHDLGVILHFRHDALLANTVILDPEWATEAVYNLIDARDIFKNKGRFKDDDLKAYWNKDKFPYSLHQQLVRLMEKFELCFTVTGSDIHIIPELLPTERPEISFNKYQQPGNLHFEYHYDFMPEGVISRFISRMYYLIEDDHFWKNGVELKFDDSTALVFSEPLNKKMRIAVTGTYRSELLAIIRNEFYAIHNSLNMENVKHYDQMIPCNCSECAATAAPHLYKHDVLMKFSKKKVEHVQCQNSAENVSIDKLLKGFETPRPKDSLLKTLITTAHHLQDIAMTIKPDEDSRNGFIALLLSIYGFKVKDQTRSGRSATGKSAGEVDIKIEKPDGEALSFAEAFNLGSMVRAVTDLHLKKLFNYDASGVRENFIIVYAEAADFLKLWKKYLAYIPKVDFEHKIIDGPEEQKTQFTDIKLARVRHLREGEETTVYHLFVNMKV